MKCPWCAYDNSPAAVQCAGCGRNLGAERPCGACGVGNPPAHRYCDACGAALPERAAPSLVAGAAFPSVGRVVSDAGLALSRRLDRLSPPRAGIIALALILAFALGLRLVSLRDVPPNVTADEADNLQVVYHILSDTGPGFFGLDWKPSPAFSTYVMSAFMRVFGNSIVSMRLASVALTTASLLAFYLVARQGMSRRAALASTFLLATGLWYLHFSRSGWENAHVGLYALLATLALGAATKGGRWQLFVAAGVFATLGLYGYISGRAIIVAVAAYLPIALALHRGHRRRILAGYVLLAATAALLFAPQLKTVVDDWDLFNRRVEVVSVLNAGGEYQGDRGLPKILAHQVWRTIDGFFLMDSGLTRTGLNARYVPPGWAVLDRLTGVLFWVGLAVSIGRWRQTALWWTMLVVMLLPVQVLSTGTPDAARAVGAAPFFFLFAGLGIDWLFRLHLPRPLAVHAGVVALLAVIAYINISGYFHWMDQPDTRAARQPAVEAAEFEVWQSLQIAEADAGRYGFNVGEWHRMREANRR